MRQKDSNPLAGGMRVIGGHACAVDIYIPEKMLTRARALLDAGQRRGGLGVNNESTRG